MNENKQTSPTTNKTTNSTKEIKGACQTFYCTFYLQLYYTDKLKAFTYKRAVHGITSFISISTRNI